MLKQKYQKTIQYYFERTNVNLPKMKKRFDVENLLSVIETISSHGSKAFSVLVNAESHFLWTGGVPESIEVPTEFYNYKFDLVNVNYRNNVCTYSFEFTKVNNNV